MGTTTSSDLVIPEILVAAIQAEFAGMNMFGGSGVAVMSNTMPGNVKGGNTIKIPYFNAMGEMEDIANEGDALTPEALSMDSEQSIVRHSGKAIEITQWAQLQAEYADPYAEAARQFRIITERRVEKALLDAAFASLPAGYIHDVYNSGTPVKLDYATLIDARTKWGDEQDDIALLSVHSKVYGDLQKLNIGGTTDIRPLLTDAGTARIFSAAGVPVKVSDKNAVSSDTPPKYTSLLAKRASLAFWYQGTPKVYTAKDPLADTDIIAIHMYWAAHRYKRIAGSTKTGVVKIVHN